MDVESSTQTKHKICLPTMTCQSPQQQPLPLAPNNATHGKPNDNSTHQNCYQTVAQNGLKSATNAYIVHVPKRTTKGIHKWCQNCMQVKSARDHIHSPTQEQITDTNLPPKGKCAFKQEHLVYIRLLYTKVHGDE